MKKRIVIILLLVLALPLVAQYSYYYGKSKVIRNNFSWKYVESPHFKVYYYLNDPPLINLVVAEAEKAYARISLFLDVTIEDKTPIIFYDRQTDIEQTNLYPGLIPPGSFEGFTEPIGHRVVVYGNRSATDLSRLLSHELAHSFENEILYKNVRGSLLEIERPPLWVLEGFADFITGYWDSFFLLTVVDAVLNDRIPEIQQNGDIQSNYASNRTPYDFGHLMCDFMYQKFGKRGIKELLQMQRRSSVIGKRRSLLENFDFTPKTFNFELKKFARGRYQSYFGRENPEEYSFIIGPDFPFAYSFSHLLSPSGELLAVITANYRTYELDVILISMKDGKVIKNITPGLSSHYDDIQYHFNPTDGRLFCWDKQGDRIAFFVRQELKSYLVVMDIRSNRIIKKIRLRDIQKPSSPVFHPQSGTLYFTGIETINSNIYTLDLETEKVQRLTSGDLFIAAIDISPDGRQLVFSGAKGEFYKLYLSPIDNPAGARQLTSGASNDICPSFSNDGRSVFFSSDERGAYNICGLDVEKGILSRYTDVRSGAFFPIQVPQQKGQLVISTYHKGSFLLFKKEINQPLEQRSILAVVPAPAPAEPATAKPEAPVKTFEPAIMEPKEVKSGEGFRLVEKKYKPLSKLVVASLPPISVGIGSNGGFFGSTYLTMTDLMGDHSFFLLMASELGYRSYHVSYMNQKRRLQYYLHLFSMGEPYYLSYNSYNWLTIRSQTGGQLGVHYPFSRSYRAELYLSLYKQREDSDLLYYGVELPYGQFFNGWGVPLELSLVGETTRFAGYGPNKGATFKLTVRKYLPISSKFMDAYNVEADVRKYIRIDNNTLLAFKLSGFLSGGKNALLYWSGGNNSIRSVYFRGLVGNQGFIFNGEFRFPVIHAALTPIGLIGPLRGVLFCDLGGLWMKGQEFRMFVPGGGLQLRDAIASYGYGLEFFLFGFPFHVEWVYMTDLKKSQYTGVNFWIGFDF